MHQLACGRCGYDLVGIPPAGRVITCPECANRMKIPETADLRCMNCGCGLRDPPIDGDWITCPECGRSQLRRQGRRVANPLFGRALVVMIAPALFLGACGALASGLLPRMVVMIFYTVAIAWGLLAPIAVASARMSRFGSPQRTMFDEAFVGYAMLFIAGMTAGVLVILLR